MYSETQISTAEKLLKIKAVKLSPQNMFTWASGIKSPIYCDNRKILSYPEIRNFVKKSFAKIIKENFAEVQVIAGVATGAIAVGVLVAEELNLPFVYIRPEAKKHGLQNKIEGVLLPEQKVVIIEDLISTGMSSLAAFEAVKENGNNILGMAAIFSYNLNIAYENFKKADCKLVTLTDFDVLINNAVKKNEINSFDLEVLLNWKKNF